MSPRSGGATIIDLAIHRINLVRHLVGDPAASLTIHSEMPDKVDDNVWLLTRFPTCLRNPYESQLRVHYRLVGRVHQSK
jgi:predicted dehydrogenase